MKRLFLLFSFLPFLTFLKAQEVKVEFVTPSIIHVIKGTPTRSLVVTAKPEDVKLTRQGHLTSSDVLAVRQDPKTGALTFLTAKGQVLLR